MSIAGGLWSRLNAVEARLIAHAAHDFPSDARTPADPSTGETWEAGQVWAHMAEFVPYWLRELTRVIDRGGGNPVPFGRTKADPERIAAIERDRSTDRAALWSRVSSNTASLRAFLDSLPDDRAWAVEGRHPSLGTMNLVRIVDEFLVGHLEQHADQLDALST